MQTKYEISDKERENIFFFVLTVLTFFRYSYFGFDYTPYLDDYVQYSFYPSFPDPWQNILTGGAGILLTRPLAGLADFFLWSRFYENLGVIPAIISLMYGVSGVMFSKALKKFDVSAGPLFFAVFLFLPANSEGTYWISASTRIVVSLFFISASILAAANEKTLLFFLFNFLSMWFYEQTALLSFAVGLFVSIEKKSPGMLMATFLSALALFLFYFNFASKGDNAHRMQIVAATEVPSNVLKTARSFFEVLFNVNFKILTRGFARGFNTIAKDFSILWISVLTILTSVFFALTQNIKKTETKLKKSLLVGFVLMLVPLAPFFVVENSVFNLRNLVPSLPGLAIVVDAIFDVRGKRWAAALSAVLIFAFSISSVSEVGDYNYTANRDALLAQKISQQTKADTAKISVKINTPKYYTQNAPYNDHIMSMTGSDWGLSGIVRTLSNNRKVVVETVHQK
ncbi:MAG: hypothetical protein IJE62_05740 [Clostridia bacterium]|nr:hypothetical protein [Clostridia bacterium]